MLEDSLIRRFISLNMQITACNLHCEYCYVPSSKKERAEIPCYDARIPLLERSFAPERLGGIAYIYMYADGETLLPPDIVSVTQKLLEMGHYIGIVTNLTHQKRVRELMSLPSELINRLTLLSSLHYLELKRQNALTTFFELVRFARAAGASCVVRLCLAPSYISYIQEIRLCCLDELGELPQITHYKDHLPTSEKLEEKLHSLSRDFPNAIYHLQKNLSDVKRQEFCHAGQWSYAINFVTGEVKPCLFEPPIQNLYDDFEHPLSQRVVGYQCRAPWCVCGAHLLGWGVIESFCCPTYERLLSESGDHALSSAARAAFSHKLSETNFLHNHHETESLLYPSRRLSDKYN